MSIASMIRMFINKVLALFNTIILGFVLGESVHDCTNILKPEYVTPYRIEES